MCFINQLKQNGLKEVVVLHVTDNYYHINKMEPFLPKDIFSQIKSKICQQTRQALEATERELRAGGFNVKIVTRSGHPVNEILKVEKEEDVSGVVMGSHNPSGLLEKFFGSSMAEAVVNKSKVPVLVVKH
jgi:nucleotide-binding universal stress UspA family protein